MKTVKTLLCTSLVAALLMMTGCNNTAKSVNITDKSPELEQVGYSLGYLMGSNNKNDIPDLNIEAFEKGIRDGYSGDEKKRALTQEQMEKVLMEYQKKREAEITKEVEAKAKANKEAGEKFLAENEKKEGVQKTASGLQYKVITEGTGAKPKATDTVTVHYEGKLIDGKVFDSSDLAYGETGNPNIEPNSVLIFTVELLDEAAAKKAQADAKAKQEAQMAELQKLAQQTKPEEAKKEAAK